MYVEELAWAQAVGDAGPGCSASLKGGLLWPGDGLQDFPVDDFADAAQTTCAKGLRSHIRLKQWQQALGDGGERATAQGTTFRLR